MTRAPRIRTEPLDPERFAHPEADDRPGVRWWWQGRVSTEEMSRQLRAIAEAGFREVEIAFSRVSGATRSSARHWERSCTRRNVSACGWR
ncbi:hypothetical protein [Parafrigoribacterium humi]|uniref:hypothetical protein n=1 Tax=Parafrigoribacterium humi TaxID=3144664 RepID=UPI0032ED09A1